MYDDRDEFTMARFRSYMIWGSPDEKAKVIRWFPEMHQQYLAERKAAKARWEKREQQWHLAAKQNKH